METGFLQEKLAVTSRKLPSQQKAPPHRAPTTVERHQTEGWRRAVGGRHGALTWMRSAFIRLVIIDGIDDEPGVCDVQHIKNALENTRVLQRFYSRYEVLKLIILGRRQ